MRSNGHRVYSHGQRLAQGRHSKIELLRDRDEVLLEHHGVLGHPPVAGEADGHALGTQLRGTGATGLAAATTLHRDRDHPVSRAHLHHVGSDRLDDAGELVAQRYGRLNPLEPGVRPERVNVATADATRGYPERHFYGTGSDGLYVLDAGCSGLVARFHESFHPHTPRVPSLSAFDCLRIYPRAASGPMFPGGSMERHPGGSVSTRAARAGRLSLAERRRSPDQEGWLAGAV